MRSVVDRAYPAVRERVLAPSAVAADAVAALELLERDPAEPFLLNATGVLLSALGETAAARHLVERAVELDPDLPAAQANLDRLSAQPVAASSPGLARRAAAVAVRAVPASCATLSLCIVVRDEEELLPACLEAAAPAADELVVVDTGSADSTVAIAEAHGARVVRRSWDGSFSAARNAALDEAHGDWVLFLDADEHLQVSPAAVRALLARSWREAFLFPLTSLTGDGSTSLRHASLRLWRNRRAYRFEGRVHERLRGLPTALPERFELVDLPILHHGYLDRIVERRRKVERNLELLAGEPPGAETSFNLGSELARARRWGDAARSLDAAWEALGDAWPEAGFGPLLAARAARARRETGRVAEAEALLEDAIARLPEYTDLSFELAHCALARGAADDAAQLLRRCLEQGDAPAELAGTAGAGSHLARALLDRITHPG
jgi:glycosyl transferase family 2/tetratricopeptide repeat protein